MANPLVLTVALGASISGFATAFGKAGDTLKRMKSQLGELGKRQERVQRVLTRAAGRAGHDVSALRQHYERLGKAIANTTRLREKLLQHHARSAQLSQERGKLAGEMRETAMFAAAAAAPFVASARAAASFEDRIKDISITGGFSREEETGVGNAVRTAALKWNQTQEEIAGGLSVLVAGGISDARALERYAPTFARVATATRASMEELGASSIALKDNLNIGAEGIEAALNQMHYAGKQGQFEMKDMAKWFPALTPMLQSLGGEGFDAVAELSAALQIARKGAGSNDEAANNLKNFLAKITAPDTIKKFSDVGIDIKARMQEMTEQGMSPMMAMLENIRAYMSGMDPKVAAELQAAMELKDAAERQAALDRLSEAYKLGEIFRDMQAMSFIRPALANREEFERIKAGALAARNHDIIGEDFEKRMEGAQEQWRFFKTHILEVAITIGDALLPALNGIITTILPAIRWVGEFVKAHPGIVKVFAAFLVGATAARLALLGAKWVLNFAFLTPINAIWKAVVMLRAKWALLQGMWVAGKFAPVMGFLARLGGALRATGVWLSHMFVATLPLAKAFGQGLLWIGRAALSRLVAAVTRMGHAIRALGPILARLGSGFLASAQAALHAALAFGRGLLQGVLKSFQLLGQGLMWVARVVIPLVGRAMVWLGRIFLLNPIGLALTLLATAATLFYTRWEGIKGGFLILCQQISEAFTGLWARIRPAFSGGLAGIAALILNWSPLGLFYRAFAGVLSWFGVELPARFTDYGRMLVEGLINGIGGAVGWLIEKAKSLGGSVSDAVKSALGIASPSKVMMEIGGFAMQGLELGMAGGQEGPLSIISRLSGDILSAIRAPLANLGNLMVMPPLQPMPALAGAGGGPRLATGNQMSAPSAGLTVNIVVNPAPGMDEKKLAELVTQKLKEAQLGKEARARSRLADSD